MTQQETMMTELLDMRKRAEQVAQNIEQIRRNLRAERQALEQVINEYCTKRVELFKEELRARGMTWCTYCSAVLPEGEAKLLLLEGKEEYSCGYEDSCYSFRGFLKFHRACPKCREAAADKHGTRGSYDKTLEDQASFYAFRVEKREDGYYARKFGNWVKVDEKCKLSGASVSLVEKFAGDLGLPPRIEIEGWSGSGEKLVIHERATTAEAF